MKEMVGGCCVCSDERGWTENPLVYCDGSGCTVAVHQACYGIVSVPSGPWFCRKCESQDGSQARVRCELCPSRDGALKRSDGSGWAHVVCALYIPEVRFGNVTTMEPIILTLIPTERFNKSCYICELEGRGSRASVGACMQCNKAGCRSQFHVTCAQSLGLLCEEAGNYQDNVKYCGYCQHHYSKLKGGNVKTIPPYKPVALEDEDKERGGKRKPAKPMGGKDEAKAVAVKPVAAGTADNKAAVVKPAPAKEEAKSVVVKPTPAKEDNKVAVVKAAPAKEDNKAGAVKPAPAPKEENKFTTCNFTETVVTEGGSVFGGEPAPAPPPAPVVVVKETVKKEPAPAGKKPAVVDGNKKRRSVVKSPPLPSDADRVVKMEADADVVAHSNVVHSNVVHSNVVHSNITHSNTAHSNAGHSNTAHSNTAHSNIAHSNVITGSPIVVSVPLGAVTQMSAQPTLFQQLQQSMVGTATTHPSAPSVAPNAAPRTSSQPEPSKRRRSVSSEKPAASVRVKPRPATSKRASRSNQSPPPPAVKDSPPSPPSPPSPGLSRAAAAKGKKKPRNDLKFPSAAHMLGNRLNPASHMSQKLGESLSADLEAHAGCGDGGSSPLTGPQLHSRVIASVRQAAAASSAASSLAGPLGLAFASASAAVPQSLDQLLERQWEQGSQFLMEQAQHFDIASLLSCLHQLRAENLRLEEHVNSLLQRRDHLLAVNARLAIPLTTNAAVANANPPANNALATGVDGRMVRPPYENGLDSVLYPTATATATATGNPSPRSSQRTNQSFQAGGYQGGSPLPGPTHPKHS